MHLRIEVILTEEALAEEFLSNLKNRRIPEKFFYWFPLSVQAWLGLCSEGAYQNYTRSKALVEQYAKDIAHEIPAGPWDFISLGAGQGDKDVLLLNALRAAGRMIHYHPVDTSMALLETAVFKGGAHGFPTHGTKADFTDPTQLEQLLFASPQPLRKGIGHPGRLFCILGNTLGAGDPASLLKTIHGAMNDNDLCLIDGELFTGQETLDGYDNEINRRFAFAPLASLGLQPSDGTLTFELEEDSRKGLCKVTKHFTLHESVKVHLVDQTLQMEAGQRISMSPSHKYDESTFVEIFEEANFVAKKSYASAEKNFVLTLIRPTDPAPDIA